MVKPIIYQLLPRLFTNYCENPRYNGTLIQNGSGKLNSITPKILDEIKDLGITHVWYTGVIEHAHDADYTRYGIPRHNPYIVKGHAGSPYAITDYYDIDPDIAENVTDRIGEFERLIERTHKADMKAIIDFVPNHVSREYHSDAKPAGVEDLGDGDDQEMFFSPGNNFFYITRQQFAPHDVYLGEGDDAYVEFPAKATGNDCYTAFPGKYDWYETAKLNYGVDPWNGSKHFDPVPSTWHKMLDILLYWAGKGVDGFRCDMAHMVPLEFWNWAIGNVKSRYPEIIFIAEMYDIGLYRPFIHYGGFDYLYDKVNLYDTLHGIETSDVSAANLTSCWQTVEGIAGNMLNFLENHDEVRYASPAFAGKAENVTAPLVVSSMMNTGPMMIYAGQELGEDAAGATGYSGDDGRTSIFDYCVIPTLRQWLNKGACDGTLPQAQQRLRDTYAKVLKLCNEEKAISEGAFFDLMYVNYNNHHFNPHHHYAFLRHHEGTMLLIAVNFGNQSQTLHIDIPQLAFDMARLPKGIYQCTELLSSRTETFELAPTSPWITDVEAHGAVIWKVEYNEKKNI